MTEREDSLDGARINGVRKHLSTSSLLRRTLQWLLGKLGSVPRDPQNADPDPQMTDPHDRPKVYYRPW